VDIRHSGLEAQVDVVCNKIKLIRDLLQTEDLSCEQDLCYTSSLLLLLVMISFVTQSAVCAVLSCMHVLLSTAAADNGMDWSTSLLHFCICCAGEVCQSLSASHCLEALVCKQALLEMHVWPACQQKLACSFATAHACCYVVRR